MRIVDERKKEKPLRFQDLDVGTSFKHMGNLFTKIQTAPNCNAIKIVGDHIMYFDIGTPIEEVVKVKVVIEGDI